MNLPRFAQHGLRFIAQLRNCHLLPRPFNAPLLGLVALMGVRGFAQTNTFPSSGNVGIGTTNPQAKLHVASGTALISGNSDGTYPSGFYFAGNMGLNRQLRFTQSGLTQFCVQATASDGTAMTDTTLNLQPWGGNVGIGTTNPWAGKLMISGLTGAVPFGWQIGPGAAWEFGPNSGAGTSDDKVGLFSYTYSANHGTNYVPMQIWDSPNGNVYLLPSGGNVGIGTTNPAYPLSVNGTIEAKEVIVQSGWADYVFDERYKLAPLSEVEKAIKAWHHLPGIPSAKEVADHGVEVGKLESRLLAQIEELTLRAIQQQKQLEAQAARIERLEHRRN